MRTLKQIKRDKQLSCLSLFYHGLLAVIDRLISLRQKYDQRRLKYTQSQRRREPLT
jgi:hypothetical protein